MRTNRLDMMIDRRDAEAQARRRGTPPHPGKERASDYYRHPKVCATRKRLTDT